MADEGARGGDGRARPSTIASMHSISRWTSAWTWATLVIGLFAVVAS